MPERTGILVQLTQEIIDGEQASHADEYGKVARDRAIVYGLLAVATAVADLHDSLGNWLPMAGRGI